MGNVDGFKQALEALQALDEPARLRILSDIAKKNPQMAYRLKESLFEFSDIQFLLPADFKTLWWEVPRKTWQLALRKAASGVLKMLQTHLTKRAYAEFAEMLDAQGPQSVAKVLQAQKEICDLIRKLVELGKMAAPSSKRNDPMV